MHVMVYATKHYSKIRQQNMHNFRDLATEQDTVCYSRKSRLPSGYVGLGNVIWFMLSLWEYACQIQDISSWRSKCHL